MTIQLTGISKRFNYDWIFRGIDTSFSNGVTSITGPNGAGKSTLLRIIAGYLTPSEGSISYLRNEQEIDRENIFKYVSISAPYIELIQEFTTKEMIQFQMGLKPFRNGLTQDDVLLVSQLENQKNKQIKFFSSGMQQRLKTALAVLADSSILLLDEPTTNFDEKAVKWYDELLMQHLSDRIVLIASNQQREYTRATSALDIAKYKTRV